MGGIATTGLTRPCQLFAVSPIRAPASTPKPVSLPTFRSLSSPFFPDYANESLRAKIRHPRKPEGPSRYPDSSKSNQSIRQRNTDSAPIQYGHQSNNSLCILKPPWSFMSAPVLTSNTAYRAAEKRVNAAEFLQSPLGSADFLTRTHPLFSLATRVSREGLDGGKARQAEYRPVSRTWGYGVAGSQRHPSVFFANVISTATRAASPACFSSPFSFWRIWRRECFNCLFFARLDS